MCDRAGASAAGRCGAGSAPGQPAARLLCAAGGDMAGGLVPEAGRAVLTGFARDLRAAPARSAAGTWALPAGRSAVLREALAGGALAPARCAEVRRAALMRGVPAWWVVPVSCAVVLGEALARGVGLPWEELAGLTAVPLGLPALMAVPAGCAKVPWEVPAGSAALLPEVLAGGIVAPLKALAAGAPAPCEVAGGTGTAWEAAAAASTELL
mmetsp:Transcript_157718/g.382968  ORF Transcript_157718/g.382968 Transcript_157718/m.382968 type:complete len:211 (+) Transcript_157718:634-1266(+)